MKRQKNYNNKFISLILYSVNSVSSVAKGRFLFQGQFFGYFFTLKKHSVLFGNWEL